ncbi:unnamed protein product [Chrysoparadoxa australica]
MPHSHRAGGLRQSNKRHKGGGHSSKRGVKDALGGRLTLISSTCPGSKAGAEGVAKQAKLKRINKARQARDQKRGEVWLEKRAGTSAGAPKIALWVALSGLSDPATVQGSILSQATCTWTSGPEKGASITAAFAKHKHRITFMNSKRGVLSVLEAAKVADLVIPVLNLSDGEDASVDETGEAVLTALKAQGLPAVIGVVQGIPPAPAKRAAELHKFSRRFFDSEFASVKVADGENKAQLLRTLTTTPLQPLHWRQVRSYMLADATQAEGSNLRITGYLRGRPLGVNQLLHVGGIGPCKIVKINAAEEPVTLKKPAPLTGSRVLAVADPSEQESLDMEAEVDGMAGEQTWPTEEELAAAASASGQGQGETADVLRPKGWSTYQAAWLDGEGQGQGQAVPVDSGDMQDDNDTVHVIDAEDGEEWRVKHADHDEEEKEDDGMDLEGLDEEGLMAKASKEAEDREFPDEVDTPENQPARVRYARYRALESFRTSEWDCKESLPQAYARIYQFEDFLAVQKQVVKESERTEKLAKDQILQKAWKKVRCRSRASSVVTGTDAMEEEHEEGALGDKLVQGCSGTVESNTYVELELFCEGASAALQKLAAQSCGSALNLTVFSLLTFENKLSVLHFNVKRDSRYTEPVASKDSLLFCCGLRRWRCRPIFSQISLNCDKHKYERFLQSDCFAGASCYAPATFQPAPVLIFKESMNASGEVQHTLVANGSLQAMDPDRIILKRIMLTGSNPIRVHKRKAVVKHMFNFVEDILWFKPAELTSKYGLTGHIREPVGTHGLMKVNFNKAIKQNDTVCLNLYKRVYPKMDSTKLEVL